MILKFNQVNFPRYQDYNLYEKSKKDFSIVGIHDTSFKIGGVKTKKINTRKSKYLSKNNLTSKVISKRSIYNIRLKKCNNIKEYPETKYAKIPIRTSKRRRIKKNRHSRKKYKKLYNM